MKTPERGTDSIVLTDAATRLLKASALGRAADEEDLKRLRAAADPGDEGLTPDELACHILLREVRKRRQETLTPIASNA